jgi:membrane fusion protein (multidrug efflux system)
VRLAVVSTPALALLTGLVLAACDDGGQEQRSAAPAQPAPAVGVVAAAERQVAPAFTFNGRIEAVDKVDLRARIAGFLEKRAFEEGQEVKQGDFLFVIEKQQYETAVQQAQAVVAQAEATLTDAGLQLARGEELVRNRNIPQSEVDARHARRDTAKGQLLAAQAQLRQAQISLGYTDIGAPIAGKIGRSLFSEGSFVGPDSGSLATIVSQDPIYVTFPVSSRELLQARKEAEARGEELRAVRIKVRLPDGTDYDQTGAVNFVDNQVDPTTDTMTVRASMPNPQRRLVDGQLVGVTVERAQPQPAVVVPQAALLADQAGPYVLVVGGDGKVEQRRIEVGQPTGSDITIPEGLKPGDRVVVDGIQKVRPGQTVQVAQAAGG